jgi:uncharacterized membrane protein (UPF0127 family)
MAGRYIQRDEKGRSSNQKRLVIMVLLLIVLLIIYSVATYYDNLGDANQNLKTEPEFKKQGELTFKRPDGSDIVTIDIEVADNEAKTAQGLMYRTSMRERQGMLFIFPDEQERGFWMRNTRISLDLMYVSAAGEIVSIHKNAIPYSQETIPSIYPARFVVEVNAGFSDKYSIGVGDFIAFELD